MSEERITREQIEQDRQTRIQQCSEQIAATLEEFDCQLVGAPQITQDGRIATAIQIVSKS
jgi:hypothetical protein